MNSLSHSETPANSIRIVALPETVEASPDATQADASYCHWAGEAGLHAVGRFNPDGEWEHHSWQHSRDEASAACDRLNAPPAAPKRCTAQETRWGHQTCRKARPTDCSVWCDHCFEVLCWNIVEGAEDWSDFLGSEDSLDGLSEALPDLFRWRTTDPALSDAQLDALVVVSVERCESPYAVNPPFAPTSEPDDLAEWLDAQAAMYRVGGNDASAFVARMFETKAAEVRALDATTVSDFEAREEVMRDMEADQLAIASEAYNFDF